MATAPKSAAVNREDIPDAPEWFSRFLETYNPFAQRANQVLTKGLTFGENFAGEVKSVTLTAPELAWRTPTLQNSWVNLTASLGWDNAGFRVDAAGQCYARGVIFNGTAVSGTVLFTLPVGYRPARSYSFAVDSNSAHGRVNVLSTGDVTIVAGSNAYLSLAGLAWEATTPAAPDAPAAPWPLTVQHGLRQVGGLLPIRTLGLSGVAAELLGAPSFDWALLGDGSVSLRNVYGLTPGKKYRVDLLLFEG